MKISVLMIISTVRIEYLYKRICNGMIGEENAFGLRFFDVSFAFSFAVDVPIEFGYSEFLQRVFLQALKLNINSF